jgi:hypothetical protein
MSADDKKVVTGTKTISGVEMTPGLERSMAELQVAMTEFLRTGILPGKLANFRAGSTAPPTDDRKDVTTKRDSTREDGKSNVCDAGAGTGTGWAMSAVIEHVVVRGFSVFCAEITLHACSTFDPEDLSASVFVFHKTVVRAVLLR